MSMSDLSKYTSEFLENLIDDRKRNQGRRRLRNGFKFSTIASPPKDLEEEIIREITKRILQNRYGFSRKQVDDLFFTQKNGSTFEEPLPCNKDVNIAISNKPSKGMEEETIGDMAHRLLWDKLSIRDVRAEAYALALSAKNANAGSSHLTRLRRELRNLNASLEIIECQSKKAEAKRIDYLDEFILESVKERLDAYNIKTLPDYQALANVIVMLCIHPAELKTLCIIDTGVPGYMKNRGQPNIPRKFRSMEKNQERAKELLTWIQHNISSG
ncbi:11549_t:CDS:2 [Dentiscutata erythropus]|uniref:11549_t:CDS:1 n=1 Tax=Dentiscutata erythropus TaxID=1348616 RepID=A0A9N9JJS0_9GLOM|nr:11549_t:CDS:2 [Dentiscutata erythropus]